MISVTYLDKSNQKHYRSFKQRTLPEVAAIANRYAVSRNWYVVSVIKLF